MMLEGATDKQIRPDPTPYCLHCGKVCPKLPEQTWEQWEELTFCDNSCRGAHRLSGDELLTELGLLIGTDTPSGIARRLGCQPKSLARRLMRMGRSDLAKTFERVAA
jgi:hypothetical protein